MKHKKLGLVLFGAILMVASTMFMISMSGTDANAASGNTKEPAELTGTLGMVAENESVAGLAAPLPESAPAMTVAIESPITGDNVNDSKITVNTPWIAKNFILKSDADLTRSVKFLKDAAAWRVTRATFKSGEVHPNLYWLTVAEPITGKFDFYLTLTTDGPNVTTPIWLIGARAATGHYFKVTSPDGMQATFENPLVMFDPARPVALEQPSALTASTVATPTQ